jgi:hypothetical protein
LEAAEDLLAGAGDCHRVSSSWSLRRPIINNR